MNQQTLEAILICIVWIGREIIQNSKLKNIIEQNSKHIEENKKILSKIKRRIQ